MKGETKKELPEEVITSGSDSQLDLRAVTQAQAPLSLKCLLFGIESFSLLPGNSSPMWQWEEQVEYTHFQAFLKYSSIC